MAYSHDLQLGAVFQFLSIWASLQDDLGFLRAQCLGYKGKYPKRTGWKLYFFFFFMFIVSQKSPNVTLYACSVAKLCLTLRDPKDCRLLCAWDFLGNNTAVSCHFLLQGI